jgi:polysaccharide deacetylase family protein (PEP-CTERM system associated)
VSRAAAAGAPTITTPTIITIDVEEWFHGHNYLDQMPPSSWSDQTLRVEKGMALCLDLLDRRGVKATFFVLGWTAERFPDLVREIARRGHEVGCHSYGHPEVFHLTMAEFRADGERALEALARAGVDRPQGYRAPSFSITPPVHHYLSVLQELGFRYDCSLFPVRHPRYGQPGSPRTPFRLGPAPDDLLVIPMPTWRCLGFNVPFSGGGYLRLLPWPAFTFLRDRARAQGVPSIVYLHPWEMDDFRPEAKLSPLLRLRSQGRQDTMPVKLERILAEGPFATLAEHARRLGDGGGVPIRRLGAT